MKIFFISPDIPYPGFTGGSIINWSITNCLVQNGHEVTVFSNPPRYGLNEIDNSLVEKMLKKIKTIDCNFINLKETKIEIVKKSLFQRIFSNKYQDYYRECYSAKEIEKVIRDEFERVKPDIIICYGSPAIYYVRNLNCTKLGWCDPTKSFVFASIKNQNLFNLFSLLKLLIVIFKVSFFQKKIISEFNKINTRFIHSKDFANDLIKQGAKTCEFLLPPFYDANELLVKKEKKERSYFKVLIIGLLSNINQSQLAVLRKYVFPYIEKNIDTNNIQFHFIGAKHEDLPSDFKKKSYVIGRGFVDDIFNEIKDCDLLFSVTPRAFGLRTRLCEALSLGACIITSKYDQISLPFLKDNQNCYIVDDIKKTGSIILQILNSNEKNIIIKKNARKAYEQNLSYHTSGEKFNKFLLENKSQ